MSEVTDFEVPEKWVLLVADSEPDEAAFTLVARQAGWKGKITIARNPDSVFDCLRREAGSPSMVVVDQRVPGALPDLELIRRIRKEAALTTTRVVALSRRNDASFVEDALSAGADECCQKPAAFNEYRQLISELFRPLV